MRPRKVEIPGLVTEGWKLRPGGQPGDDVVDGKVVVAHHDAHRMRLLKESRRQQRSIRLQGKEACLMVVLLPGGLPPGTALREQPLCWRKLLCPSHFSLLQLHVLLQVAFGFSDIGAHGFFQIDQATGEASVLFEIVEPSIREALLEDASDGAGIAFVQFSHPHQWNHLGARLGRPKDFTVPPVTLLEERAFRVGDVLTSSSHELFYQCGYGSAGKDMSPRPWTLQITLKALRPRVGIDRAAQAVQSGDPYPACIGAQGAVPMKGARSNSGVSIRQYNERVLSGMDPRNSGRTYWQDGPSPSTLSRLSRRIHDVFCDSSPDHLKCNMCRWRGEWCSTKAGICSGTCCIYCRHHAAQQKQGLLSLVEAKGRCNEIVAAKKVHRSRFVDHTEASCADGTACPVCSLPDVDFRTSDAWTLQGQGRIDGWEPRNGRD